jgi:HSP20 family molecular chaperone IbpA
LSFDDDFKDPFEEFDIFKLMKKSQSEMEKLLEEIRNGKLRGTWEIRQIDEPEMKGYAIRGRFGTEGPLEPLKPLEPLQPSRRNLLPEKPLGVSKAAFKEMREPLVDIFEDDNRAKIYVELPGVEKEDIKLHFGNGSIEIKARNFRKTIDLPHLQAVTDSVSTEYKNGVLQITIPKEKQLRKKDANKLRVV